MVSSLNGHFNGHFDFVKRAVRLHFYFLIAFELPKAVFGALSVKKQKNGIRFCNILSGNDQLEIPVVRQFQEDWSSFIIVEVDNRLNETIHKVNANHGLRGFDAIHLASALTIGSAGVDNFFFACYNKRVRHAAQAEGLETSP